MKQKVSNISRRVIYMKFKYQDLGIKLKEHKAQSSDKGPAEGQKWSSHEGKADTWALWPHRGRHEACQSLSKSTPFSLHVPPCMTCCFLWPQAHLTSSWILDSDHT